MAGISIAIRFFFKNKIKTIHIQNPKISRNQFDLLLIPEHDAITGKNIIQTKGALSFFLNQEIQNKKNLIYSTLFYFDSYRELPPIIGGVSNME